MRIDILLTASLAVFVTFTSRGQGPGHPPARQIGYHNQFSTGVLAGGEHGLITGSVTTVHGITVGKWAVGAGVGIEGYERWRTVPVFGSLSYYFHPASTGMFITFEAGHGFGRLLWANEGIDIRDTKGGPMISPMIGYYISAHKVGLSVAAGYKMQRMTGHYRDRSINILSYTIEETMESFYLRLGVSIL